MSTGYQIYDGYSTYYLTFQIIQWADVFTRQRYRDILCDSFTFCTENKGLRVHAYCIMSNHVHCILSAEHGNLSDIIRDCKAHTARTILHSIQNEPESRRDWLLMLSKYAAGGTNRNENLQLWTHDNHAVEIQSDDFFLQKLNYTHLNPVRAGLVREAEHYLYSSAADYFHRKQMGPAKIAPLEIGSTTRPRYI